MTVVVIGGTGFIGRRLIPLLVQRGQSVVGMDNCFEAARLCAVGHTVYASSLAVSGQQKHFGDRAATEEDFRYGDYQYAVCKIFNEWQAKDYRDKYGMVITGVRPANVTG